jgi:alpha-glucosidase (family GH31 glycosyl hydrolase)
MLGLIRRNHLKRQNDVCGGCEDNGENENENEEYNEDNDDEEEEEEEEYLKSQILLANKNKYSHNSATQQTNSKHQQNTVNDTALHDLLSRANLKQYLNAFIEQG